MGWAAVVAAVVGAGGPLMYLLRRLDKRNTDQHNKSIQVQQKTLAEVLAARKDIGRLETRVDRHLEWHAEDKHPQR